MTLNLVVVTFALFKTIVGIFDGDNAVSTIPAGAIIETPSPIPEIGLVQVRYDGRLIWVLASDLRESGWIREDKGSG